MSDKSSKASDAKLDAELEDLRAEVERLTKALDEAKTAMRESLGEHAETLREKAENVGGEINDKAKEGWHELQTQIAEKPVQSALIALGIGIVLSRLLSR
tara:strand:- start:65367 stop:65666 length:300 start_codon:yes stop_codon:yes gene_type:complete